MVELDILLEGAFFVGLARPDTDGEPEAKLGWCFVGDDPRRGDVDGGVRRGEVPPSSSVSSERYSAMLKSEEGSW